MTIQDPSAETPIPLADDDADTVEELTEAVAAAAKPTRLLEATPGGVPSWAKLPPNLRAPKGVELIFMRFLPELTATPAKGERQAILWTVSVGDKKLAAGRAQGDINRIADELGKQMIRAIDGELVSWDGTSGPGNIDAFWNQIGEKYRSLIARIYVQLHTLDAAETQYFFEHCVVVRKTG